MRFSAIIFIVFGVVFAAPSTKKPANPHCGRNVCRLREYGITLCVGESADIPGQCQRIKCVARNQTAYEPCPLYPVAPGCVGGGNPSLPFPACCPGGAPPQCNIPIFGIP